MRKSGLLPLLMVAAFSSSAMAEDDLMSLFNEKPQVTEGVVAKESDEIQKIKALVGETTAEQNIFFQYLSAKDNEKALFQWSQAFENTTFQASANGKALGAWLEYKNGLKISAIEKLMAIPDPKNISANIVEMWREQLVDARPLWGIAQIQWTPEWTDVLGANTEIQARSSRVMIDDDLEGLKDLVQKTAVNSTERAWVQWQLVLNLAMRDDVGKAAQVLNNLMGAKNNPIGQDLMDLTAGRLLYQNGYLDAAIKYYDKIPKKSNYWFVTQEEKAWAYMRKGEPQNSLAISRTLVEPSFKNLAGPESFLVNSFASLKVCDYPKVMETIKAFPVHFKNYALNMSRLSEDPHQPAVEKVVKDMTTGNVSLVSLKGDADKVPHSAFGDRVLSKLLKAQQILEQEAGRAAELYGRSLTFGMLQGKFETFKNKIEERAKMAKASSFSRIKDLAVLELGAVKQTLEKLHIVEAEMIQQIATSDKLIKLTGNTELQKKTGTTGSKASYAMTYPVEKEVWFDELANYKVDIQKGCQAVKK